MEQSRKNAIEAAWEKLTGKTSEQSEANTAETDQQATKPMRKSSVMDTDLPETYDFKQVERSAAKEENFGSVDLYRYKVNEGNLLKSVGDYYKKDTAAIKADPKIYYTQVVENAVKAAQLPGRNTGGKRAETVANGFILETLAKQLERKYEDFYKKPGEQSHLSISIYSAVGSALDKDKGVVAIVECSTPDHIMTEKFYLLTKGYKRDIRRDEPEPGKLWENYKQLDVAAIQISIPFGGFAEENDFKKELKNTLPKKICNDAVEKILKNFKQQEVSLAA